MEMFAIFYACFCFVPYWTISGSFHRQNQSQWQLIAHFGQRAGDENTAFPYQLGAYFVPYMRMQHITIS